MKSRSAMSVAVALAACGLGVGSALAEAPMPAGSPGRFTMIPADGGVLRMDTETGAISMCRSAAGAWSCTMLPDDRAALADEVTRLKSENEDLKSSVKRLEDMAGLPPADGAAKPQGRLQLPTEEDVDKAMTYVERMLKKFKDKLKELEADQDRQGQKL